MWSFIVKAFHTCSTHCGLKSSRVWLNVGLVSVTVNDINGDNAYFALVSAVTFGTLWYS